MERDHLFTCLRRCEWFRGQISDPDGHAFWEDFNSMQQALAHIEPALATIMPAAALTPA